MQLLTAACRNCENFAKLVNFFRKKFYLSRKLYGHEVRNFCKPPNVMGQLCRNYADENNQKISICFRKKFTKQKRENWNRQKKSESWNLTINRRKTEV